VRGTRSVHKILLGQYSLLMHKAGVALSAGTWGLVKSGVVAFGLALVAVGTYAATAGAAAKARAPVAPGQTAASSTPAVALAAGAAAALGGELILAAPPALIGLVA